MWDTIETTCYFNGLRCVWIFIKPSWQARDVWYVAMWSCDRADSWKVLAQGDTTIPISADSDHVSGLFLECFTTAQVVVQYLDQWEATELVTWHLLRGVYIWGSPEPGEMLFWEILETNEILFLETLGQYQYPRLSPGIRALYFRTYSELDTVVWSHLDLRPSVDTAGITGTWSTYRDSHTDRNQLGWWPEARFVI